MAARTTAAADAPADGGAPPLAFGRFAALVGLQVGLLAFDLFGIVRARQPLLHAALLAAASVPWLWLSAELLRGRCRIPLLWVLVAGVLLRVLAQFATPALSDDLYRYVWEGRVQLAGHNPYLAAPADPSIAAPGDPIWEGVNNKPIPAAYPPVCQLWLRALAATGGGLLVFRSGFALCELLLLFVLAAWLARLRRDPAQCLVLALCPVAIVEWSAEGHNDSLAALLLVAALACLTGTAERSRTGRWLAGGALLGAAIGAKLLPLLFVPWVARRHARALVPAALVLVFAYACYWPGFERAGELFGGTREFGARWRHNDSLFVAIHAATAWMQDWLQAQGVDTWFAHGEAQRVAKLPLALLFGALALLVFARVRDTGRAAVPLFAALFALTPVLHPWYAVWCVPFLVWWPWPALFVLLTLVSLSHHTLARWHAEGVWEEQWLWKLVQYVPFYLALFAQPFFGRVGFRARGSERSHPPAA